MIENFKAKFLISYNKFLTSFVKILSIRSDYFFENLFNDLID